MRAREGKRREERGGKGVGEEVGGLGEGVGLGRGEATAGGRGERGACSRSRVRMYCSNAASGHLTVAHIHVSRSG